VETRAHHLIFNVDAPRLKTPGSSMARMAGASLVAVV
jgi:hypothetical protein